MIRGHHFHRSPLSQVVPLEGSDTVLGLRQIDSLSRSENLKRSLGVTGGVRQRYARYKGPYFHQLTPEHLKQPPKAWLEFLCVTKRGADGVAYNVPLHVSMLCERMEENLIYYLGNYITILAAFGLHIMLQHPWCIISLIAYLAAESMKPATVEQTANSPADTDTHRQAAQRGQAELSHQDVRWFLLMFAYVAFFFAGCGAALLQCIPLSITVVALHAALRRAPSEQCGRSDNALGVSFRRVFSWGGGGAEGGEDPHRLFKELGMAAGVTASNAALYCWHAAHDRLSSVWQRVLPRRFLAFP